MGNFSPIARSTVRDMKVVQAKLSKRRGIRTHLVGNDLVRDVALLIQEFAQNLQSCAFVSAELGEDFKNLAFVVNGAPKVNPLATDTDENLIKMPGSRRLNSARPDLCRNRRPEFQYPAADGFIADIDPALCQHFLDIPKAQWKAKIEPDGPLDY